MVISLDADLQLIATSIGVVSSAHPCRTDLWAVRWQGTHMHVVAVGLGIKLHAQVVHVPEVISLRNENVD